MGKRERERECMGKRKTWRKGEEEEGGTEGRVGGSRDGRL